MSSRRRSLKVPAVLFWGCVMREYVFTVRVRLEAFDDVEVRQRLEEVRKAASGEVVEGMSSEVSLQEVFKNKAPRKLVL